MAPPPERSNESAATLRLLRTRLGLDSDDEVRPIESAWSEVRTAMIARSLTGQKILQPTNWISDFWVARGAIPGVVGLAPVWMPPDRITDWPALNVGEAIAPLADRAARSNHDAFAASLQAASSPIDPDESARAALDRYLALKSALVPRVFDVPAIQTEHVRVWLASSVGHLLMAAALAPAGDPKEISQPIARRFAIPAMIAEQLQTFDELGDRHLEILYNARFQPDGRVGFGALRTGQGEEWRDHWLALSLELDAQDTLNTVQLAAALLRSRSLFLALEIGLASTDEVVRQLAVGVARRWILALQAMAWLESALQHPWSDVRPRDLCCFAFNATKPDWPRRVVAVSHRSKDVKQGLRELRAWRAARFAIDANYCPSWESNVGMVWGLFAATPAIVRVESENYADSVWCRRERELSNYLLKQSDFLTERWIVDLEPAELSSLDAIVGVWNQQNPEGARSVLPEFPPLLEICSPSPMPAWEARMLRAGAALRLIHAIIPDAQPEVVNRLALLVQTRGDLPGPTPTNNPDGWRAYATIFREASELAGGAPDELAVRLPPEYDRTQTELDSRMSQRVPDLQSGSPSLRDVLVAMEWLRVEYPQWLERGRGDYLAINCQRISRDQWEKSEEVSLQRGLAAMRARLSAPVWIIQLAGQDVDLWPLVGETPIFTEHVSAQFAWMLEGAFDRRASQQHYPKASGLLLAPGLEKRCRGDTP